MSHEMTDQLTGTRLGAVLADLDVESEGLDSLVAGLDVDGWRTPTPADGWDVATSIAHLAWTDGVAVLAATDKERWDEVVLQAIADPHGFVDTAAAAAAAVRPEELVARWRAGRRELAQTLTAHPAGERIPWFGPPMSPTSMATARFMETWAHGLDVAEALGAEVSPHDRVRHVVYLGVRTRGYSFVNAGLEAPTSDVHVALVSPGGETWEYGDPGAEERVTGSAWDFALLVTQRRHRSDLDVHADGPDADRWLDLAQAFAGPAGNGREPAGSAP